MSSTVQTRAVVRALNALGHATNVQLHEALRSELPELSLTSLHRISARLVERGEIGTVATDARTQVLDARADVHDHFVCARCGGIVDIIVPRSATVAIQEQLGTHLADAGLVVRGTCAICRAQDPQTPVPDPSIEHDRSTS